MDTYILNVDSSQLGISNPNDYTVTMNTPLYSVSDLKVLSGVIPLTSNNVNGGNNSIIVDGTTYSIAEGNYDITSLEVALDAALPAAVSTSRDITTNTITFTSGTAFTLSFGENSLVEVLGFTQNVESVTTITSGSVNLGNPRSLVLQIINGDDELSEKLFVGNLTYTARFMIYTDGDRLDYKYVDDPVQYNFKRGNELLSDKWKIKWFYSNKNTLHPYDFRGQHHTLKFELTGTTDKLKTITKTEETVSERPTPVELPQFITKPRFHRIMTYALVILIILIGVVFIVSQRKRVVTL